LLYEQRIIAFVDILGFENIVDKCSEKTINSILSTPRDYFKSQPVEKYKNIQISIFSDSIIISFIYTEEQAVYNLLLDFMNILIKFIEKEVICRGYISKGEVIHDENMLFGPGFIEAYKMEKKMNFPRIGFSDEIYQIGLKYHDKNISNGLNDNFLKSLFIKDEDGLYYVDYFSTPISSVRNVIQINRKEYLTKLLNIIVKGLADKDINVVWKYIWMKHKFEKVLDYFINISDDLFEIVIKDITKEDIQNIINLIGKAKNGI